MIVLILGLLGFVVFSGMRKEKKEEVREAALKEAEQAMKEEKETAVLEAKADGKTEETK